MKHSLFSLILLFSLLLVGCAPREVRYVIGGNVVMMSGANK